MAREDGVDMLIALLQSPSEQVQRQAAKALANLGVNCAPRPPARTPRARGPADSR